MRKLVVDNVGKMGISLMRLDIWSTTRYELVP
jgi:hypothetical protein